MTATHTIDFPSLPPLGERLVERWGGLAVSGAFFLMLLSLAGAREWLAPARPPEPARELIRVSFAAPPPEPLHEPLEVSAASATQPNPDAEMALEQLPPPADAAAVASEAAPPPLDPGGMPDPAALLAAVLERPAAPRPGLTEEQRRRLEQDAREVERAAEALEQRRQELALESEKRYMESRARHLSFASAGAQDGVVRRLDLRGISGDILKRVLDRNGIDIVTMNLDGTVAAASPIGSVATDSGDYHQRDRIEPGYYEVFRMSSTTFAKIARLESEYMRQHRLDPEKTQWIAVTYGVRHVGGTVGYDLVIVDANFRRLE